MGGIDEVRSPALWGPAASASPWGDPGKLGRIALGSEQLTLWAPQPALLADETITHMLAGGQGLGDSRTEFREFSLHR